jgi:hypothetical protein
VKIREWWLKRRERLRIEREREFEATILKMLKTPDSIPNKVLKIEAMGEAKKIAMTWLDNRRINHCGLCPENRSLMKLKDGSYRCPSHNYEN